MTLGGSTLQANTGHSTAALVQSESAPILEEAAILFANNQPDMAEHALQSALHDDSLGHAATMVWRMLFDLYQVTGKQEEFDQLSIEFASKFETSPPSWTGGAAESATPSSTSKAAAPIVAFSGKLDNNIIKQVERAQNLAAKSQSLRLEFAKVTAVDPIGCGILLSVLKKLQKSGNDLVLVGALELVGKIRSILEVGRRNETEAPWLLMLELLRLLNLEKEFEETSIDYCVTFEVSPPPFVAPQNKVTTEIETKADEAEETENFMMPSVIEGKTDQLIASISAYTAEHPVAILDCSRLTRVDFNAAGQLLTGLAPLAAKGAQIEFHHVNQLGFVLLQTMGMHEMFRITHRKH
jgi:anti-anti-sigma regulatory factor